MTKIGLLIKEVELFSIVFLQFKAEPASIRFL